MTYLKFCYYDFELSVPKDWVATFEKKVTYQSGMAYFTTPNNYKLDHFWDKLEKYTAKNPTAESFMKSYFDGLKKNKNLKELNIIEGSPVVNDCHETFPHEITYAIKAPLPLTKTVKQKIIGNTIYCKATNRFIAIYTAFDTKKDNPDENAQREVIKSFTCSCNSDAKL